MSGSCPVFRIICTIAFLLALSLMQPPPAAASSLAKALPNGFLKGWTQEGKIALFDRENLFEQINGEAELYFPYGFTALATAVYGNKAYPDALVVAEIYHMGSLLDAFGIYSNYRKPDYESVKQGAEGFISPTQLLFYQDRYFVKLQATGTTHLEQEVFLACARLISGNLPANTSRPEELAALLLPSVVPKSERYIAQSLLGYAFFRRGFIAEAKANGESMRVIVVREETRDSARKAFDAYHAYLREEGQVVTVSATGDRRSLTSVDSLYGGVYLVQSDRVLLGVVKVKDMIAASRLIEQIREKIAAPKDR
jgi:hypothetical protein